MKRNLPHYIFACLVLAALTGCVQKSANGSSHVFTYEIWVPLLVLMGGIVGAPAGWFVRHASARLGWGLLILAPIGAIFFAPSLFMEKVVVHDDALTVRSGIWGMTANHDVKFDNVQMVRLTSEEVRGRRGRKTTNYYLVFVQKDGSQAKVSINNNVTEAAAPLILEKMDDREIPIINET